MFSGPTAMSTYITRCQHQGWMRVTGKYIIVLGQDEFNLFILFGFYE